MNKVSSFIQDGGGGGGGGGTCSKSGEKNFMNLQKISLGLQELIRKKKKKEEEKKKNAPCFKFVYVRYF